MSQDLDWESFTKKNLEFFFSKVDDLHMVQLTQKMHKILNHWKKNGKNALTSHYANGHGDPHDKWVKKHFDASTGHQVNFLKGLGSDIIFVKKFTQPQFLAPKIYAKKA